MHWIPVKPTQQLKPQRELPYKTKHRPALAQLHLLRLKVNQYTSIFQTQPVWICRGILCSLVRGILEFMNKVIKAFINFLDILLQVFEKVFDEPIVQPIYRLCGSV